MQDSPKKVYEQIIEDIQSSIIKGEFKKGDKLPTERELVKKYNVSRSSIREALRILDVIGLIESIHGSGNYITNNFSEFCFEPISLSFKLQQGNIKEIQQLRNIFEVQAAVLTAKNCNNECKNVFNQFIGRLNEIENLKTFNLIDKEIHLCIAKFSGNKLLYTLYSAISKLVELSISEKSGFQANKITKDLICLHVELCEAICSGNSERTKSAASKHAEMIYHD